MNDPSSCEDLHAKLRQLAVEWENEVVEFKEATDNFSTSLIGKYFSALSNEANLQHAQQAWLIFGVSNETHRVVGTTYRLENDRLQQLKMQIAQETTPRTSFTYIHVLDLPEGRVIMFEIPPAPTGFPVAWQGHWYGRRGESLTALDFDKLDTLRNETDGNDWTAAVVDKASIDDLDEAAVKRARNAFLLAHANRIPEEVVAHWDNAEFLDRARLTHGGKITRAALLLLGKPDSVDMLPAGMYEMTWKLVGSEQAYEHFSPPFFLNTTALYQRIRNIQIRLTPANQLLTQEVSKYDEQTILEAIHNCIAHQDYRSHARILVTEYPDTLTFENQGSFFQGEPDDYILHNKTPDSYRNPFLVRAMTELNMIDRMGYGIKRMNEVQARRYLPLPDYDLTVSHSVKLTVYGRIVSPAYTQLLLNATDLPLEEILALDRVQKGLTIPDEAVKSLRRKGMITGRKPHLSVTSTIASVSDTKAEFIRAHSQDDAFYWKLIEQYLLQFGSATRSDIDNLLDGKLGDELNQHEKSRKIANLLTSLRRAGKIVNTRSRKYPLWRLNDAKGSIEAKPGVQKENAQ